MKWIISLSFWKSLFFTALLLMPKRYDYITATHTGHLSCLILYTIKDFGIKVNIKLFLQHVFITVCFTVGIDCCPNGIWAVLLNVPGRCSVGIWDSMTFILIEIYCCLSHFLQTRTVGLLKIRPQPLPSLTFPIHYSVMNLLSGVVQCEY
jgi:hypothetical protein